MFLSDKGYFWIFLPNSQKNSILIKYNNIALLWKAK